MLYGVTIVPHYDGKMYDDMLYAYETPRAGNTEGGGVMSDFYVCMTR